MRISVDGADRLIAALNKRAGKLKQAARTRVRAGYSAPYAIYVHENLEAFHPVGQAKFLEEPARLFKADVEAAIAREFKRTRNLERAFIAGAELLLELSGPYVPVDTGFLRNSGFVEVQRG